MSEILTAAALAICAVVKMPYDMPCSSFAIGAATLPIVAVDENFKKLYSIPRLEVPEQFRFDHGASCPDDSPVSALCGQRDPACIVISTYAIVSGGRGTSRLCRAAVPTS